MTNSNITPEVTEETIVLPSKAAKLLDRLASWSNIQIEDLTEARNKITAKFEKDFLLSSFDIDGIVSAQAYAEVAHQIQYLIEGEVAKSDEILAEATKQIMHRALSFNASRSTSAASNSMSNAEHEAWIKVASMVNNF